MRQGIASLIVGLSLVLASFSWASFTLSNTLLDPGSSERLAESLSANSQVRGVVIGLLANAIEAQVPEGAPVTREDIESAATRMMDDPRVQAMVTQGIVATHQNAIAGNSTPVQLDAAALGDVGRQAIVDLRPEFAPFLPAAPQLAVTLPNTGLSWIGSVKAAVDRFTMITAMISLAGMVIALVTAKNRPAMLRRVAFWAFGASALWLALSYGIPALLGAVSPDSGVIASAAIHVFIGAMTRPALILAIIGGVLLAISVVWPMVTRREGAYRLDRNTHAGPRPAAHQPVGPGPAHHQPATPRPGVGSPYPSPNPGPPPAYGPAVHAGGYTPNPAPATGHPRPAPPTYSAGPLQPAPPGVAPAAAPHRVDGYGQPQVANTPRPYPTIISGHKDQPGAEPQWVEGQGYTDSPPPAAPGEPQAAPIRRATDYREPNPPSAH